MKRSVSLIASALMLTIVLAGCSSSKTSSTGDINNAPSSSSDSRSYSAPSSLNTQSAMPAPTEDSSLNDIEQTMTGLMSSLKTLPDGIKLGPNLSAWLDRSDNNTVWVATKVADTTVNGDHYTLHLSLNSTIRQPDESIEAAGERAYTYTRSNIDNMQYIETPVTVVYDKSTRTLEKE